MNDFWLSSLWNIINKFMLNNNIKIGRNYDSWLWIMKLDYFFYSYSIIMNTTKDMNILRMLRIEIINHIKILFKNDMTKQQVKQFFIIIITHYNYYNFYVNFFNFEDIISQLCNAWALHNI
jgi:hypothetical protein